MPDVVCERAFFPLEDDLEVYRRTNTELFTLESRKPLSRFDIVAFSVSFENDYPNILKILSLAKIPLRSSGRNTRHPLVVMGGVCCFYNPEPLADFMDICFVGEAEDMLPEFIALCRRSGTRSELYQAAMQITGIYIPHCYIVDYDAKDPRSCACCYNKTDGQGPFLQSDQAVDHNFRGGVFEYVSCRGDARLPVVVQILYCRAYL
jgi:hypothetical protein